ncbi:hypothetical protein KCU67_g4857, partial [Aureobasidium melanogenum]
MKFFVLLSVAGLAATAPLSQTLPQLPRQLDIKGSDVPVAGKLLTNIINALPVDASVAATDNVKRALAVDLGGIGVDLKKNKRALAVDLGGIGVDLKKNKRALAVDLGGIGVDLKKNKKRALLDGLDIQGSDVPLLGQLLTEVVDSLPVNVSVSVLDDQ